jgi:peptidoglycan/xylan/chitin deacetylase (PgdA/CDA1 family)
MLLGALALAVLAVAVLAHGLGDPRSSWLMPAVTRGAGEEVLLTFDDGPSAPATGRILDVLREKRVKAVFFVCGSAARRHPELVRRMAAEGHEVGNHTDTHPYLYLMSRADIAGQLDRTQATLESILGRKPRLFRPPYGVRWFPLRGLLAERGLTMMLWTDRAYDGRLGASGIVAASLKTLRPGAILLLHDGDEAREAGDRSATAEALPAIIDGARAKGLVFASPDPLIAARR